MKMRVRNGNRPSPPSRSRPFLSKANPSASHSKQKGVTLLSYAFFLSLVEMMGFEPTTCTLRTYRSPS